MKKTRIFTMLAAGLIGSSALAIDSWSGDRFIFDAESNEIGSVLKVNLSEGVAKVSVMGGQGVGTYYKNEDKIIIDLNTTIDSNSYKEHTSPETGEKGIFFSKSSTDKVAISGSDSDIKVIESGRECIDFDGDGKTEVCTAFSFGEKAKKRVLKSSLNPVSVQISVGDSFVVPLPEMNMAFVKLEKDGVVAPAEDAVEVNHMVQTLQKVNGKIKVGLKDGSTITYGEITNVDGQSIVIGVHKIGTQENLVNGAIVLDQKVSIEREALIGSYSAIFSGGYGLSEGLKYHFNGDGFGAMETKDRGESLLHPWTWEYKNSELEALRYILTNEGPAQSVEDLRYCLSSEENCYVYNKRSYKVLAQYGDKYIMLRKFQFQRDPEADSLGPVTQSVWTMKKID